MQNDYVSMDQNHCYFKNGQYYFGWDAFTDEKIPVQNVISFDKHICKPLSDSIEMGLLFVQRDNKYGIFTMHECGMGGYGKEIFISNIYPFIYDEVLLNGSFQGDCVGYVAVRINHSWGVVRVQDHKIDAKQRAKRPCMMIVPCIYPTKEKAISFIHSKDYHPEYGWRDPFKDDNIY